MTDTNKNQNTKEDDLGLISKDDDFIDDLELIPVPEEKSLKTDELSKDKEKEEGIKNKKEKTTSQEKVEISTNKIKLIKKLLENIKENNEKIINLLSGYAEEAQEKRIGIGQISIDLKNEPEKIKEEEEGARIVEGVFDGENMIGPDGKQYNVPANYASKSKLIEGDILKLTIPPSGTFIYKQIGPIERSRIVGILEHAGDGNYFVKSEEKNKKWRVLTASVTYFKGQVGDEVIVLVPKNEESKWAAVDNIVKTNSSKEEL